MDNFRNKIFYNFKPFIPRILQIALRRILVKRKLESCRDIWPIAINAGKTPVNWSGWPDKKRFAVVLTHDVESAIGVEKCIALARLEENLGFRSSFNFVIKDYPVPPEIRQNLVNRGFEVGVHGLTHDGRFFQRKRTFFEKSHIINQFLSEWNAVGYRTPAMLGNLEWLRKLNIEYDASTFDTDPFEPRPHGVDTIFPFLVDKNENGSGFVELPYTLPQDFTLYVIMQEKNIDIWKKKLDWIAEKGGMALVITHPDYMNFTGRKFGINEYPVEFYKEFLGYIKTRYEGKYWQVLPKEIARFWSKK